MNSTPSPNALPGRDDPSAADVDPRFDDAAVGTGTPRAESASADAAWRPQWEALAAAGSEWVRGKPMQALALAAGLGFLLGRSGR